jgi:hypothetical protein
VEVSNGSVADRKTTLAPEASSEYTATICQSPGWEATNARSLVSWASRLNGWWSSDPTHTR